MLKLIQQLHRPEQEVATALSPPQEIAEEYLNVPAHVHPIILQSSNTWFVLQVPTNIATNDGLRQYIAQASSERFGISEPNFHYVKSDNTLQKIMRNDGKVWHTPVVHFCLNKS